jgi:hypothetical protein
MHKSSQPRIRAQQKEDDFMALHSGRGSRAIYIGACAIETLFRAISRALKSSFGLLYKKWRATFAARHSRNHKS